MVIQLVLRALYRTFRNVTEAVNYPVIWSSATQRKEHGPNMKETAESRNNQYSHFPDRTNNTHPQRVEKMFSFNSFGPLALEIFSHCVRSLWDPCFTHIIARAVEIVSTVHGNVEGMHLSPAVCCAGFREVTWRQRRNKEVTATGAHFSFICPPS